MLACLFVGIGGFIGAIIRYLIGLLPYGNNLNFPVKTFIINVIGSFIIGLIIAYTKGSKDNIYLILFLKVGLCGGFTTFSSFSLETFDLIQTGNSLIASLYIILSLVLSITAIFMAQLIFK